MNSVNKHLLNDKYIKGSAAKSSQSSAEDRYLQL